MSADAVEHGKTDTQQEIAQGNLDVLRGSGFHNRTWITTMRFCQIGDGVDSLEGFLHSLWDIYCQVARYTSHETRDHDRLVLDIVRIQGRGPLTRRSFGRYGIDIARTTDGTIWNDLPFLAGDMAQFWMEKCAVMSAAHRLNFASFAAKLASTRAAKDRICQLALLIFRDVLETDRRLRTDRGATDLKVNDLDGEDARRFLDYLDLVRLLPAASAWIEEAPSNITQLSSLCWNDCPSAIGQGGRLFLESPFGKQAPTGFSPWRWMFWLKRLHEIRDKAKEAGEDAVEKCASESIDVMTLTVEEWNSDILRVYKESRDIAQKEKHLSGLMTIIKERHSLRSDLLKEETPPLEAEEESVIDTGEEKSNEDNQTSSMDEDANEDKGKKQNEDEDDKDKNEKEV